MNHSTLAFALCFTVAPLSLAACGSPGEPGATCSQPPSGSGEGTYYDADGSGACSFPATPDDLMVAAMNVVDYGSSGPCGACVHIDGPRGSVQVRIVDLCPGCKKGNIDLSAEAFPHVADPVDGRVPISWRVVPCPVVGPIVYHFKDGSNPWWTAVQIRTHRHPIATVEAQTSSGQWIGLARQQYNYFVAKDGLGPPPYAFRTTDLYGGVLVDSGIPGLNNAGAPGQGQFPACAP